MVKLFYVKKTLPLEQINTILKHFDNTSYSTERYTDRWNITLNVIYSCCLNY